MVKLDPIPPAVAAIPLHARQSVRMRNRAAGRSGRTCVPMNTAAKVSALRMGLQSMVSLSVESGVQALSPPPINAPATRTKPKHPRPLPIVNAHPEVPALKTNTKPRYPLPLPTETAKPAHPTNTRLLDPRLVYPIANKTYARAPHPMLLPRQGLIAPRTARIFAHPATPEKY